MQGDIFTFYTYFNQKHTMDKETLYDIIAGSLVGGAAGDALGYTVEFESLGVIKAAYGKDGISAYEPVNGVAQISDDTQMTLFTADALTQLRKEPYNFEKALRYIKDDYLAWFRTQGGQARLAPHSVLEDIPELHSRRAPGITCLSALGALSMGRAAENDSKGCGGAMRVAPIALYALTRSDMSALDVASLAGEAARLTHLHPLGFISAAYVATLIYISCKNSSSNQGNLLYDSATKVVSVIEEVYGADYAHAIKQMTAIVEKTVRMAREKDTLDIDNIRSLGEGWVGEEAVGIALYCALRHNDDFSAALRAAVNHDGDSDSTGAICGNILGAIWGYDRIPYIWKENLELHDTLLATARRLADIAI